MNITSLSSDIGALLCAPTYKEQSLTIALVVFVILTVLLLAFVIMIFAWKRFREFIFGDKPGKTAKAKPKAAKPAAAKNKNSDAAEAGGTPARQRRSKQEYDDGVPTVPLGGFARNEVSGERPTHEYHSGNTLDKIPTVVIRTPVTHDGHGSAATTHDHVQTQAKPTAKPTASTAAKQPAKSAAPAAKRGKTPDKSDK